MTLAAIGQQLVLHIEASFDPVNFFSYFTNLSNLFAAFTLMISAFQVPSKTRGALDTARYLSAVNMTVVGVVFSVLLRNADLGALLPWVNFVLHYVMPAAIVVDWLAQPPAARLDRKFAAAALVFPAGYLVYVLVRGASIGWYPYPFL
ncbi:MAG: Pr6Pr family membrane protein, partial [Vicinamibacterales bacterium]